MKLQKLTSISKYKLLILAFLLILMPNKVQAIVPQTKEFYVNDAANLISSKTEEYIINKSNELYNVDGTQIVVVTVNDLEGMSIEEYATTLFREYGIGDKDKNNGLLLLLSLDGRKFRVEVGYGLEGILPDGKTGRFQDEYIIPYLKNNEWDKGIKNGYDAFFDEIVKQNNLDIEHDYANTYKKETTTNKDGELESWLTLAVMFGFAVGAIWRGKIFSILYVIVMLIIYFYSSNFPTIIQPILIIFHLIGFFIGKLVTSANSSGGGSYYGGGSFGGSSSSGGGSFGGGGSSGGGGSTRGF